MSAYGKYYPFILPLMILINKLELGNTPEQLFAIRAAYFTMLLGSIALVGLTYRRVLAKQDLKKIWVSPPGSASLVASEAEKNPPRKQSTMLECEMTRCKTFLQTTALGACITCFLHFYGGVTTVAILQCVMLPINLYDLPTFRIHVLGAKIERPYKEKFEGEDPNQEAKEKKAKKEKEAAEHKLKMETQAIEKQMTRVWALRKKAKFTELLKAVTDHVNYRKKSDRSTPLMVVAGSSVDTQEAITCLLDLEADITLQDDDGWTAFHWASYHNRPDALRQLYAHDPAKSKKILSSVKDKKGFTPGALAKEHSSTKAAEAVEELLKGGTGASKKNGDGKGEEGGLRRRGGGAEEGAVEAN